ncbi:MAG: ABC transporter ATP-binding protein [Bacilli bacterium]|nr:ABC transporter ATP-binding protein [Bacilli bacterium]
MEDNFIITLEHLNKSFGDSLIVDDFNLSIKKGEFVTFLGPSGCGKTTTLRMISGFEIPTKGRVLLNGKDVTNLPPYKRPINTVFQRYALFPHLDVYDNVAFGLKLKKTPIQVKKRISFFDYWRKRNEIKFSDFVKNLFSKQPTLLKEVTKMKHLPPKVIDQKVARALKIVDLEDLEDRSIDTLSGGQQQRVAIARAIVNEPEILLLDEPLGALDLKMRKEMQIELKEMHKKLGITFIYVTHDQEEALTMSDTVIVMKGGVVQQVGTPTQIYNEPKNAFVADFIGESNIYSANMVDKKRVRFLNWTWDCVDDFEINENVDVVVRPEDIILLGPRTTNLIGTIKSKIFKGVHYEYIVVVGKSELQVRDTRDLKVDSHVSIKIDPQNIQIMKKQYNINAFYDAYITKNNKVAMSDDEFDCDLTQLLPGSKIDSDGYLTKNGVRYNLTDAPVAVEIDIKNIELSDDINASEVHGVVINSIWKGDYYQVLVRSASEEDYVLDTQDSWNVNDIVSIIVKKENINLRLKGDISKYEEDA